MGTGSQIGLVLWKNIILRKRQPFVLFIELLWPIVIFLVVALVRRTTPPEEQDQCYYAPRSLPSSGFPFLQSFVCNLDNKCYPNESAAAMPPDVGITSFLRAAQPLYKDTDKTNTLLKDLPKTRKVLEGLKESLDSPEVKKLLDMDPIVANFLRDPKAVKKYLVDEANLTPSVVDTILQSTLNISKMYELTGYIDFKKIACNSKELQTYLMFEKHVSVKDVSEQLCRIDDSRVSDIVEYLQGQIDVAQIIKFASELKDALGEYTEAEMLEDVALLMELLVESKTAKGLLKNYPNLKKSSEWVVELVKFINGLQDGSAVNIQQLQTIFEGVEPFFRAFFDGEDWYKDTKNALQGMLFIVDWLSSGTKSLYEMPLKLANMLYNKTELNNWMTSLNLTKDIADEVLFAQIDNERLFKVVDLIWKGGDMKQILCEKPGFVGLFHFDNAMSERKIKTAQDAICRQNLDEWSSELTNIFNTAYLVTQMDYIVKGQMDFKGVNWTDVYQTGLQMFNGINNLLANIEPIFGSFSFDELWNSLAKSASGFLNMDDLDASAEQFAPLLGNVQAMLESSDLWDSTLRQTLVLQDLSLEIGIILYQKLEGTGPYLANLAKEDMKFQEMINKVIMADRETVTAMILAFTNQTNIEILVVERGRLDQLMCDEQWLMQFMNPFGDINFNKTLVREILCNQDTPGILEKMITELDLSEVEKLSTDYQSIIDGKLNLDSPENLKRQNISAIFSKTMMLVRLMSTTNTSMVDWARAIQWSNDFGDSTMNVKRWTEIYDQIVTEFSIGFIGKMVEVYGEMIEQSSLWETIGPIVFSVDAVFENIVATSEATMGLYTNENEIGHLLNYILKYGPELMNATAEMITNSEKVERFAKSADPAGELCDPEKIRTYLDVPAYVPLTEIQSYMCNINWDKLINEIMHLLRLADTQATAKAIEKANKGEDFDWVAHFRRVQDLVNTLMMQVQGTEEQAASKFLSQFDWNALMTSMNSLMTTMTDVPETSLQILMLAQGELMDNVLPYFGNETALQMPTYYVYSMSEMMRSMSNMMDMITKEGITLEMLAGNSTYIKDLVTKQLDVMPELMDAVSTTMLNPQKMMKTLFEKDLSQNTLCGGLRFTDIMNFKNEDKINEYEDMLCSINTDGLMEEIMRNPMMAEMIKAFEMMTNYDPSRIPAGYEMNFIDLAMSYQSMNQNMNKLMKDGTVPVFPDVPGFNMTEMEILSNKMLRDITKLDMTTLTNLMGSADYLIPMLYNMTTGDEVARGMMNMVMGALQTQMSTFKFAVDILNRINGSKVITLSDLIDSPELGKVFAMSEKLPDVTTVLLNAINHLLRSPDKVNGLTQDAARICENLSIFELYFPKPAGSNVDIARVQNSVCTVAGINVTVLMEQIVSGIGGLDDMMSMFTGALMNQSDSFNLNLTQLVTNVDMYTKLLGNILTNPPTSFDIGLPVEWLQPSSWESFIQNFTVQFQQTLSYLEQNSVGLASEALMNEMLGSVLIQMQSTFDPEMRQLFSQMGYIVEMMTRHLEPYVGKNVTLEFIFRDSPETTKIIQQVPHLPILLEVVLKTAISKPFISSITDPWTLCTETQQLFDIPDNKRDAFMSAVGAICAVNFTAVESEMFTLLELNPNDSMGSIGGSDWIFNITAVGSHVNKLTQLFTELSATTRWTQDYSWLTGYDWNQMIISVFEQYQNNTIMDIMASLQGSIVNDMMAQWVLDLQGMISPDNKDAVIMVSHITSLLADHFASYSGKNISLNSIFEDSPETTKLVDQVSNLPMLMEVTLKTIVSRPEKIQSLIEALTTDMDHICSSPEGYFHIPDGVLTRFKTTVNVICNLNYTMVQHEIYDVIGLPVNEMEDYMSQIDKDKTLNVTNIVTSMEKLLESMGGLALSKWTQEYSWLYNYDWNKMVDEVFANYNTISTNPEVMIGYITGQLMNATISLLTSATQDIIGPEVRDAMYSVMYYSEGLTSRLKSYIGKNITLEHIFMNSTETLKIVEQVPHIPIMLEVFIKTLLTKPQAINPVIVEEPRKMCTDRDAVFSIPANPEKAMAFVTSLNALCDVNFTIVEQEIVGFLDIEKATLDKVTIESMAEKLGRLSEVITTLAATGSWTQDYTWLYDYQWGNMLNNVLGSYNNMSIAETLGMLTEPTTASMVQIMEMFIQEGDMYMILSRADIVVSILIEELKPLMEQNITLNEIFKESPSMLKMIDEMDKIPAVIEVLIRSVLEKPQQLSAWLNGNLTYICLGQHEDILAIPAQPAYMLQYVEQMLYVLCTTNFDQLQMELSTVFKVPDITSMTADVSAGNADLAGLISNFTKLGNMLGELASHDLVWATDFSAFMTWDWESLLTDISTEFADWDTWQGKLPDMILALNSTLGPVYPQWLSMVDAIAQIMEVAMMMTNPESLEEYPNLTNMILMNNRLPEIFEAFMMTGLNVEKSASLQSLLVYDYTAWCTITNIEDYMVLPSNSSFTAQWLRDAFCQYNETAIGKEAEAIGMKLQIPLAPFLSPEAGTPAVNITALLLRISRLEKWWSEDILKQDPTSTVLRLFFLSEYDPNLWDPIFNRLQNYLGNVEPNALGDINRYMQMALNTLTMLGNSTETAGIFLMYSTMIDVFSPKLESLINATDVRLADLFEGAPNHQKLATLAEETPDVLDLLSTSARHEPFLALLQDDMQTAFEKMCREGGTLSEYFLIPKNSVADWQGLRNQFCTVNITQLESEFMNFIGIQQIMDAGGNAGPVDQAIFSMKISNFSKLIENLEKYPPQFAQVGRVYNTSAWISVGQKMLQELEATNENTVSMYTDIIDLFTGMIPGNFSININGYIKVVEVISNYINDVIEKLDVKSPNLDIGKLFIGTTEWTQLLDSVFDLAPDLISGITNITVKPEKLGDIASMSEKELTDMLCDPVKLQHYFMFPAKLNMSSALPVLCNLNTSVLIQEFMKQFTIDELMQEITDALRARTPPQGNDLLASVMKMVSNIEYLTNVTSFHYKGVNIASLFNISVANVDMVPAIWDTLQGIQTDYSTSSYLDSMVQTLESLEETFKNTGFWIEYKRALRGAYLFMEIAQKNINSLPVVNITLASVLKNEMETRKFLMNTFSLAPELIEIIMSQSIDLAEVLQVQDPAQLRDMFCGPNVEYSNPEQKEAIDSVFCQTDFYQILAELQTQWNWNEISSILMDDDVLNSVNVTMGELNYTQYILNAEALSNKLMEYFSGVSLPPLPIFMMYDGDYNAWLTRLENAAAAPATSDEDTIKLLVDWLEAQSVDPAMAEVMKAIAPYMNAANVIVDSLNNRLRDLPINLTLADILKDEPYMKDYLKQIFAELPELVNATLQGQVDFGKLGKVLEDPTNIASLFCLGAVQTVPDAYNILCKTDVPALQAELTRMIDWEKVVQQFSTINGSMVGQQFNWTAYFNNIVELQTRFGALLQSQISLPEFFLYKGDFNSWLAKFNTIALPVMPTDNWIDIVLKMASESLSGLSYAFDTPESRPVFAFVDIMMDWMNGQLEKIINAGTVTLENLVGDSEKVNNILTKVIGLDQSFANALGTAELKPEFLSTLMLVDQEAVVQMLCEDPLEKYMTTSSNASVTIKELKSLICSMNTTTLLSELQKSISINSLINKINELMSGSMNIQADIETMMDKVDKFITDIGELAANPPMIDSSLSEAFDFTWLQPFVMQFIQNDLSKQLSGIGGLAMQTGWLPPELAEVFGLFEATFKDMVIDLESLKAEGLSFSDLLANPTKLAEFYYKLMLSNPVPDKDMFAHLEFHPVVPGIVCSNAFYQSINLPTYVNMTIVRASLCNEPASAWFNNLKDGGIAKGWYSHILEQVTRFANTTGSGSAGSQIGYDMMRVMELMTELDDTASMGADMQENTNILLSALSNPEQIILFLSDQLRVLDYMYNIALGDGWNQVRQFSYVAATTLEYVNKQFHKMKESGNGVDLSLLFPHMEEVKQLLGGALSPESTKVLIAASISPDMLQYLSSPSKFIEISCDPTLFSKTLNISSTVDKVKLQKELCDAAKENSELIEQLLTLVDINTLWNEIESTFTGQSMTRNPFVLMKDQWKMFFSNLAWLSSSNSSSPMNMDKLVENLGALSMWFTDSPVSAESMCSAITSIFDDTTQGLGLSGYLGDIQAYMELSLTFVEAMPDVQPLFCVMPGQNLTQLYESFSKSRLMGAIEDLAKVMSSGTAAPFNCSAYINLQTRLMSAFTAVTEQWPAVLNTTFHCLANSVDKQVPALMEIDGMIKQLKDVKDFLSEIPQISELGEVGDIIGVLVEGLVQQRPMLMSLQEMMVNNSNLEEYLGNIAGMAPHILEELLKSSVNVDLRYFMNLTDNEIVNILCDPQKLEETVELSPMIYMWGITPNDISSWMCSGDVRETVKQLRDSINLGNIFMNAATKAPEFYLNSNWLASIMEAVDQLITDLDSVMEISSLFEGFDLKLLAQYLPRLQKFLDNNGPEVVIDDIQELLILLKSGISEETTLSLLDDLVSVADGIRGLNIFQTIPSAVVLGDLMKDPAAFHAYLLSLQLSPDVADSLLNSSITLELLVNITSKDVPGMICKGQNLQTLLTLPSNATASAQKISDELCSLDDQIIIDLTDYMAGQINIGSFVQEILNFQPEAILSRANITKDELKDLVDDFEPVGDSFKEMLIGLKNITAKVDLSGLAEAQTDTGTVSALSEIMCGREEAFNIGNSFGLSTNDENEESNNRRRRKRDTYEITEIDRLEMSLFTSTFCRDMYLDIVNSKDGRIIWSYLKPLLVGKIPFAPDTEVTRKIMTESMSMFREISKLNELTRSIADSADEIGKFSEAANDTEQLQRALENSFVSGSIRTMLGVDGKALLDQLETLTSVTPNDAKQLKVLSDLAANVTRCVENDRLEAYSSEAAVEDRALQLARTNRVLAAVVFESETYDSTRSKRDTSSSGLPKHIKYKLRMDIDNVPTTTALKDYWWKPGPAASFTSDMRYLRGFLELQDMIERAIIKLQTGEDVEQPDVKIQQIPHPCYEQDNFHEYVSAYFLPIVMMLGWLMVLANAIRNIVYDREKGLEETMKIMGMSAGLNWLGWFLNTFLSMAVLSVVVSLFVKLGNLLGKTDFFVILVFLLCFSLSTTMLGFMVSSFFQRSALAAFAGVIVYMISYLPFILVVATYAQISFAVSAAINLSSTTAFSLGAQLLAYAEQRGTGGQWGNINGLVYQNDWSFTWCLYMMLIDSVWYGLVGWYVRNVFPGKFGVAQPWYFPLSPSYWGCRRKSSAPRSKYRMSQYGNPRLEEEEAENDLDPNGVKMAAFRSLQQDQDKKDDPMNPPFVQTTKTLGPGEKDPDLPVGISLHKLKKVYKKGRKVAVDDLTVSFYKGQVTALLGRNGAGKTTTINMLSGNFAPTSGFAFVDGRDIMDDRSDIRQRLGICHQNDVLFDYMTVWEHLEFFSTLKSKLSKKERKMEIYDMLRTTGLAMSHNVRVNQLSGGQRRRLAVALAFIGGSEVVILDEPTSGVDPAARRSIWDLITTYREGRTIMLSTHHLDEADIIGDRIVIVHQGKLVCSGSPMFLKSEYGSGYHLTLASEAGIDKKETIEPQAVLTFTKQYVPKARIVEELGSELTLVLPTTDNQRSKFRDFFSELEMRKSEIGISSYGVSDTTLEEVFLKLTLYAEKGEPLDAGALRAWNLKTDFERESLASETDSGVSSMEKGSLSTSSGKNGASNGRNGSNGAVSVQSDESLSGRSKVSGASLKGAQFWAILTKRFHHHRRDVRSYLSQIILPVLFMVLAMACTYFKPDVDHQPSLMMTPDLYGPDSDMFFRTNKPYHEANDRFVNSMMHDPGVGTTCMKNSEMAHKCYDDAGDWTKKELPKDKLSSYQNPPACVCEDGWQKCPEGATGMPLPKMLTRGNNYLHNITDSPFSTADYLMRTFEEFEFDRKRYGGWDFEVADSSSKATIWYNNKGFHVLPSYYNALNNMVLRGSVNQSVHGSASDYGITVYNHPLSLSKEQLSETSFMQSLADTGIALTILCAFCFVPAGYTIYLMNEKIHREKRMQYICGVGIFMYWMAAIVWDMLSYLLTVGLAAGVAAAFQISIYTARLNLAGFVVALLLFGWATIPLMYLWTHIYKEPSTGYMVTFIVNLMIGLNTTACVFLLKLFSQSTVVADIALILEKVFLVFPQFCLGDALVRIASNQFITDIYERFNIDKYRNPFSFEMLGWHFVAMGVEGLVFFVLHLIIEGRPCQSTSLRTKKTAVDHREDSDVSLERQRVVTGEARNDVLILNNLRKNFKRGLKKVVAVDNVTFGLPKGECFGLLGVNGAGKTTTFNMITGEEIPSRGVAVFNNKVVSVNDADLGQKLGYCPQEDALDGFLTVEETLSVYSKMKGVPSGDIPQVVQRATKKMGLEAFIKKTVRTLSGGTKRKLSTALALIGDPDLVLLDEPTTGMDPQTRRLVWNSLIKVVKQHKAVVITSHSMAECDAVCTKMAIMVNGRFMCLGTSQHLKNKFGQGYTLTVRVHGKESEVSDVIHFVLTKFAGARVLDQHLNVVDFELPASAVRLSDIFGEIEQSKDSLNIQEYSVSQTTLDHVFINFAKMQNDGTETEDGEDFEKGYNNFAFDSLERRGGDRTPPSYHSMSSKGSNRVMRQDQVRMSLDAIDNGYTNQTYDNTGDGSTVHQQQSLYPDLQQGTPPQPVSVVTVGSGAPEPPHYSGQELQSEPAAVSQISVGVDADRFGEESEVPAAPLPEHVSTVHVSGISPPTSTTTTPEMPRREPSVQKEIFSSNM